MTQSGRQAGAIAFIILCGALVVATVWISNQRTPSSGDALNHTLTPVQESAITALFGLAKLLIGWSVGVIAGGAFLLKFSSESGNTTTPGQLFLVELSALLALGSLLLGCQVFSNAILAMQLDQSPVANDLVDPYVRWQYRTLLAAGMVLVAAAHLTVWQRWMRPLSTTAKGPTAP